jgi:hypothetical protein
VSKWIEKCLMVSKRRNMKKGSLQLAFSTPVTKTFTTP